MAYMYCCFTCGKLDKKCRKIDVASGEITFQCICYGSLRSITVSKESELSLQGCGDWQDPKDAEIRLF